MHLTAAAGGLGALLAFTVLRAGPYLSSRSVPLHLKHTMRIFAHRRPFLINLGYFGHMWELYALWTWIPVFVLHASANFGGFDQVMVFTTMGIVGFTGVLAGGWAADRFGHGPSAGTALAISGVCCLLSPLAFLAPAPVLTVFCAVWGASVIADSGVLSTALSEVVDNDLVGTALSAQTAIGFALTVVSIQLVGLLTETVGWQCALLILALGPVLGVIALSRLQSPPQGSPSALKH